MFTLISVRCSSFELVFNCQMGRGRTTTAMTVGCLVCPWVLKNNTNLYVPLKNDYIPPTRLMDEEYSLRLGHYRLISDIRAAMPAGPSSKRQLDSVLDLCSTIQNLREVCMRSDPRVPLLQFVVLTNHWHTRRFTSTKPSTAQL
jgi:hypothetical protein